VAKVLALGFIYPWEATSGIGHVAGTLGGVNYESRGSAGVLKGSRARGAKDPLFRHHFHIVLTDAQAAKAKRFADAQVDKPYGWGAAGPRSYDCSGFMAAILNAAFGRDPYRRLFGTGTWSSVFKGLGFKRGLGPSPSKEGLLASEAKQILEKLSPLARRVEHAIEVGEQCRSRLDTLTATVNGIERRFGFELDEIRRSARRAAVAAGYPAGKVEGATGTLSDDGVDPDKLSGGAARVVDDLSSVRRELSELGDYIERVTGVARRDNDSGTVADQRVDSRPHAV
jgi:hypothetical protein